ncbi:hypothetical protein MRY82_03440 [bacterium]|nr:hypothetical protein [bacterium]
MKYFLFLALISASLSSCMLKSQHDASIADYQERAKNAEQLQQENNRLRQEVSDLELRNQDLSTLNQQLVLKNQQLTENQFNQKNLSLDEQKKKQASKQIYLKIYDELVKTLPNRMLMLKDDFVGINLTRQQLFSGSKPSLSSSGINVLNQIIDTLPSQQNFAVDVSYQNKPQSIKRWLEKTYDSQHGLRALEAALISNFFAKSKHVRIHSVQTAIGEVSSKNTDQMFTIKISHFSQI